jgi:DNA-binding NarL/FixJ family response regulator
MVPSALPKRDAGPLPVELHDPPPANSAPRVIAGEAVTRYAEAHKLSGRETEVLVLTAVEGLCTKEIGFRLGRSRKTIEQYWYRIYWKLGCRSREQVLASVLIGIVMEESDGAAGAGRV